MQPEWCFLCGPPISLRRITCFFSDTPKNRGLFKKALLFLGKCISLTISSVLNPCFWSCLQHFQLVKQHLMYCRYLAHVSLLNLATLNVHLHILRDTNSILLLWSLFSCCKHKRTKHKCKKTKKINSLSIITKTQWTELATYTTIRKINWQSYIHSGCIAPGSSLCFDHILCTYQMCTFAYSLSQLSVNDLIEQMTVWQDEPGLGIWEIARGMFFVESNFN